MYTRHPHRPASPHLHASYSATAYRPTQPPPTSTRRLRPLPAAPPRSGSPHLTWPAPSDRISPVSYALHPPTHPHNPSSVLVPQTPQTPPPDMYSGLRPDTLSDNSDTLSLIHSSSSSSLDTLLSSASSATAFVGRSPSHGEQGGSRLKASHRRRFGQPRRPRMAPPRGALSKAPACKS